MAPINQVKHSENNLNKLWYINGLLHNWGNSSASAIVCLTNLKPISQKDLGNFPFVKSLKAFMTMTNFMGPQDSSRYRSDPLVMYLNTKTEGAIEKNEGAIEKMKGPWKNKQTVAME